MNTALGADRKWGPSGGWASFKSFRSFICLFVRVCSGSDFPMEVRGKLVGISSLLPSGARGWNGLVRVSWGALFPTEPLTCYVARSDLELLIVLSRPPECSLTG